MNERSAATVRAGEVDLVAIGETMALLSAPEVGRLRDMASLRLSVAGAESNVAIGIRRLGYRSSFIGRVGSDEFGQLILEQLRKEGVDVEAAVRDEEAKTALMFKERRTSDVVRVTYYRHGFAGSRLAPGDLVPARIEGAAILHVTGILLALSPSTRATLYRAVELARGAGRMVSFDLNYRAALWSAEQARSELQTFAGKADLVFAGEDELALLDPRREPIAIAQHLLEEGTQEVIVKRGSAGAISVTKEALVEEPAVPVHSVDPVGAGDAFVAGYLAGLLDGEPAPGRLRLGCAAGAFAVTVLGDWEGLPSREDLVLLGRGSGTTLR